MSSYTPLAKYAFKTPAGRRFRGSSKNKSRVLSEHDEWSKLSIANEIRHSSATGDITMDEADEDSRATTDVTMADPPICRVGKRCATEDFEESGETATRDRTAKRVKISQSLGDKRRMGDDLDEVCRQMKKIKITHCRGILRLPGQATKQKKHVRWCTTVVGEGVPVPPSPPTRTYAPAFPPPPTWMNVPKRSLFAEAAQKRLSPTRPKNYPIPSWEDRELMFDKLRRMQATMGLSKRERVERAAQQWRGAQVTVGA